MLETEPSRRGGARPGAGRKKVLEGQQSTSVVLDTPALARLDQFASQQGLSRSEVIRQLIARHLP